jgi:pimeloyl-ACP methyl ester carboxylesterase
MLFRIQRRHPRNTVCLSLALLVLAAGAIPSAARAQAPKKAISEDKTLVTRTGIALKITYFPSQSSDPETAPVAILLHGKAGNRLVWKDFAGLLQQNDFAVVTVDLSGHGESDSRAPKTSGKRSDGALRPAEYQLMVADDLETVVGDFLFEEHEKKLLNMEKLAIVGADFSAAVAVAYADLDWQKKPYDDAPTPDAATPRGQAVKALVLLSPNEQVPGLQIAPSLARLRMIPMQAMIGVSKGDSHDKGDAKKIFDLLGGKRVDPERQHLYFVEYGGKLRGTDLLGQSGQKVEANIYNFLDKHVKQLPIKWRDRRSLLDREDTE